jgi:hypothetical protein
VKSYWKCVNKVKMRNFTWEIIISAVFYTAEMLEMCDVPGM